jgi:flagellar protein FlbD
MIIVTRLNDTKLYVNPHLIEFMEETPDTVVTLTSGKKIVVKEKALNIIDEIIKYRKKINVIDENNIISDKE